METLASLLRNRDRAMLRRSGPIQSLEVPSAIGQYDLNTGGASYSGFGVDNPEQSPLQRALAWLKSIGWQKQNGPPVAPINPM